jgi:hypothetical protein
VVVLYKKNNTDGSDWNHEVLNEGYEHHCGIKEIKLEKNKYGILSHAWTEEKYVHLWEIN